MENIPKISREENYWKVGASTETKEEKKHHDQQERRDSFEETSDFIQLLTKDPRRYRRKQIPAEGVDRFVFKSISTHREKAILEVDIHLVDGSLIESAQVALSREQGMRYLGRKQGENIAAEQLIQGSVFTFAIPQKLTTALQDKKKIKSLRMNRGTWLLSIGLSLFILSLIVLTIYLLLS